MFPVYRKIKDFNRWYKILSDNEFIERSVIGSKPQIHRIQATQYPEKLKIMDMLACEPPYEVFIPENNHFFE